MLKAACPCCQGATFRAGEEYADRDFLARHKEVDLTRCLLAACAKCGATSQAILLADRQLGWVVTLEDEESGSTYEFMYDALDGETRILRHVDTGASEFGTLVLESRKGALAMAEMQKLLDQFRRAAGN